MKTEKMLITIFAKDRPGVIKELSDTVLAHQGNWLESSLSRLCGQFAGIVHIEIPSVEQRDSLATALQELTNNGIHVTVQAQDGIVSDATEIDAIQLMVEANDRPGIIEEISSALANVQVNVEHMDTECESASMAGYSLFRAYLFVSLPDGFDDEQLEQALETVSDDLMVTFIG